MNVTLTTADMAITLILAVVGSVAAAFLYNWLPQITSRALLWYAKRSTESTEKKLRKLNDELREYRTYLTDPPSLQGRGFFLLSRVIVYAALVIVSFVIVVGINVAVVRNALAPMPPLVPQSLTFAPTARFLLERVLGIILLLVALAALVSFRYAVDNLNNFSQPAKNIKRLEEAISQLNERLTRKLLS